jgi:putative transcriptional regulator
VAVPVKNRLRVLRAELEWSQADLAERLGVSRQTVNAIETGKYDPSLPLAFSLARTFKRRIEEIFEAEALPAETGVRTGQGMIFPRAERE